MVKFAQLPKYEAYKDSGVEWLGEIPAEWNVVRFRDLFKFGRGLTITKAELEEEGVPCINYGEVHSKYGFEFTPRKHHLKCVSEDYLLTNPNSLLEKGDFIFADTSEDIEGSGNFSQLVTDDAVFAGYHSVICRPIGRNNYRYLAYCLESTSYRNQVRQQVKGVKVYSITQAILKNTEVWLPNLEEQTLIANFLDQKTAQIDAAIAIKEQQIELLKERKQIIIQQAVTQGLDPNVPMKDSGVDWIGKVPEHWEVKKFKFILTEINIRSKSGEEQLLSLSKYHGVVPKESLAERSGGAESLVGYKKVFVNDLVINKMQAVNGLLAISNLEGITSPDYSVYRPKVPNLIDHRYLGYLLSMPGYLIEFKRRVKGVMEGFIRLYTNDLYSILSIVPPLSEQSAIANSIDSQMAQSDISIRMIEQQIHNLKEYKTTLINSAVTGKIKITPEMLQA